MHFQCWAKEIIISTTDNTQPPDLPFHDLTVLKVILPKWSTSIISNSSPNATPIFFAITP
ncbi:hypothetical protein GLOIN_2v1779985 [Rhizophagus irregularis DAOM 181602=DAOM 197198]|uniref:Uncharacterized protein n=2 Tax=Rhizophagus irregularis TaxID=588596 RepID=A0A015JSY0_RHIIW|nr:hypothetical protein GLOIN_2v1779985 [Rhizophagus irregularis DAOM 181602=DAOM 197198]EXX70435.1 hypothetical protein RirG_087550 [Rhizophagus irregularis DAOM 197198w]POG66897.1 hypothetical protein GLOIN_2v1779985 [Rhizophagus irregularis DAOM 181602=DAOM 197198]GBC23712.1 hypothetical protein GLOIN_2v1779985 [Rhizophagus irregularis DAOM 181602=DAOM 197198]|eukprot:XP_025173763.1 hypothetical protein GLOIN_2v1779985 [Rhizophagus irregularis DAOM 181602=DAOM 197198]